MDRRRLAPQKRDQILRAALEVFLDVGFERATTDAIAARAGVSKATLYNHFEDKRSLFAACVKAEADSLEAGALEACVPPASRRDPGNAAGPPDRASVETALRALGVRIVRHLLSRSIGTLHTVTIAEARRFPDLGRTLYEAGFQRIRTTIADFLQKGMPPGALSLDDPLVAASHFVWLCVSDFKLRLELGVERAIRDDEIRKAVNEGVSVFLRAYGGPSLGVREFP